MNEPEMKLLKCPSFAGRAKAKLEKYTLENKESGCLEWVAQAKANGGYGKFSLGRGITLRAHRAMWILKHGEIPDGKYVCHKCDNPACVNTTHLFLGTAKDNTRDMMKKQRGSEPPVSFGEEHHNTTLKEVDVLSIAQTAGSASLVAASYSVSERTVYRIRSKDTWVRLTRE